MTAGLEGSEWLAAGPGLTYPRERPGTHFTGGWVGPRAGLDGRKNLFPIGIRSRAVQPVVSRHEIMLANVVQPGMPQMTIQ